jgi:hypothetical protein
MMKVHKRKKNKGKKKATSSKLIASLEVQTKKPRQFNWEHGEVLVLMKAKCDQHVTSLDRFDNETCLRLL